MSQRCITVIAGLLFGLLPPIAFGQVVPPEVLIPDADIKLFANIAGFDGFDRVSDIPITVVIPAFMVSELKTAFQIGFLVFIPFLIIDLVVSSVLMSMGMMMLSPMLISLPFKLMLFVLVDGWALLLGTLAGSFFV